MLRILHLQSGFQNKIKKLATMCERNSSIKQNTKKIKIQKIEKNKDRVRKDDNMQEK